MYSAKINQSPLKLIKTTNMNKLIQITNKLFSRQPEIKLTRIHETSTQTIGYMIVQNVLVFTLELPYRDNQRNISCVPKGTYSVVRRNSFKYADHFHLTDVPDRSLILIHQGNFNTQTQGCILVGLSLTDINKDGCLDVSESTKAMNWLNRKLPETFRLKII
jgi:ATP-dependent Lon protease